MSAYPHPVLTQNTDDVQGDLSFNLNFTDDSFRIKDISVSNQYFEDLLGSEKAIFSLSMENSAAFFNRQINFNTNDQWINFNSNDYPKGTYSAELTIVSNQMIENYNHDSFHEDFKGFSFSLSKGSIIGSFGGWKFDIKKDFHGLNQNDDIFDWNPQEDDSLRGNFRVSTFRGKLVINFFKQDRVDIIARLQDKSEALMHSHYIVPAIMYGIDLLIKDYHSHHNEPWAVALLNSMYKNGFIDDYTPESVKESADNQGLVFIANKILNDPLIKISNVI